MDSHRELSVHKEHELLVKLESAGLGEKEAQAVIESKGNSLAQGVVEFIRSGGRSQFSDQKSAKLILGNRCILPGDVMSKLGMKYSDKELKSLEKIPRSAELLQELRDTHILFPTASLSILETKTKSPAGLFYDQDWYNDKEFAKSERPEVRWNLVRKDRNPGSNTKTYSQQLTLLSSNEENPSAVVLVQLMVIYYQMTGIKLFQWGKDDAVRSSSVSGGYRVNVGFCEGQFGVSCWCDDDCCCYYSNVGVASARKFPR